MNYGHKRLVNERQSKLYLIHTTLSFPRLTHTCCLVRNSQPLLCLGAFNKNSQNLTISGGGRGLKIENGVAKYETIASGKGEQKIVFTASFVDPNTGKQWLQEGI
jgi:hypothetical protein